MTDFSNGYTEYPVTIFNGGAEEGTTAGWVNEVGDLNIAGNGLGSMAPHSGTYYFMGTRASVNNTLAYNQVDLLADSTLTALQIDSGVAKVRLQWYQGAYRGDPDEYITAGIRTRESAAGAITKTRIAALAHVAGEVWRERSVELVLPVGTRFIDVCIKGQTYNGDHCDAYIDDLKLDAYIAQDVVEPPPDPTVNTADLTDVTGRLWEGNNNVKTTTEDETNPLALEIDRSGRYYIDTGRDQDLCITQNGLTATMWVNHKTVPTRATERQGLLALYEVGKQDTDQGWGLSVQWVGDGPKYVFNTGNETLVSASTVNTGVWTHVVVIAHPYDAVTPAKVGIYVNGTLDTEWEVAHYPLYEAGAFNVGRDSRLNNVDEPVLGGKEPVSDTIDITTANGKVVVSNRFPEVSQGGSLTVNYAGDDELRLYGLFDNMFDKDGYVEDSGLVLPKDGTITLDVMFDAVIGDYNDVILYAGTEAIPAKNGISSIGITVVAKRGNYTEGGSTSRIGTVLEAAPVGTDVPVVAVIGNTPDYIPPPSNPATNGYFQLVLHKAISGALTETATSGWSAVTEEVIGDWKAQLYVGDYTSYSADETITLDATAMVGSLQTHSCFADFSRDTEANVRATYKVTRLATGESYTATNGKVTKVYYAISDDGTDDTGLHITVPDGMSVAHSRGSGSDGAKYRCFYTLSSSSTVPDEEVTVGDITFNNTDPSTVGDLVIIEIEYSIDVGEVVIPDPNNPVPEEDYYAYADVFIDDLYVYQGNGWVQSSMNGTSFTPRVRSVAAPNEPTSMIRSIPSSGYPTEILPWTSSTYYDRLPNNNSSFVGGYFAMLVHKAGYTAFMADRGSEIQLVDTQSFGEGLEVSLYTNTKKPANYTGTHEQYVEYMTGGTSSGGDYFAAAPELQDPTPIQYMANKFTSVLPRGEDPAISYEFYRMKFGDTLPLTLGKASMFINIISDKPTGDNPSGISGLTGTELDYPTSAAVPDDGKDYGVPAGTFHRKILSYAFDKDQTSRNQYSRGDVDRGAITISHTDPLVVGDKLVLVIRGDMVRKERRGEALKLNLDTTEQFLRMMGSTGSSVYMSDLTEATAQWRRDPISGIYYVDTTEGAFKRWSTLIPSKASRSYAYYTGVGTMEDIVVVGLDVFFQREGDSDFRLRKTKVDKWPPTAYTWNDTGVDMFTQAVQHEAQVVVMTKQRGGAVYFMYDGAATDGVNTLVHIVDVSSNGDVYAQTKTLGTEIQSVPKTGVVFDGGDVVAMTVEGGERWLVSYANIEDAADVGLDKAHVVKKSNIEADAQLAQSEFNQNGFMFFTSYRDVYLGFNPDRADQFENVFATRVGTDSDCTVPIINTALPVTKAYEPSIYGPQSTTGQFLWSHDQSDVSWMSVVKDTSAGTIQFDKPELVELVMELPIGNGSRTWQLFKKTSSTHVQLNTSGVAIQYMRVQDYTGNANNDQSVNISEWEYVVHTNPATMPEMDSRGVVILLGNQGQNPYTELNVDGIATYYDIWHNNGGQDHASFVVKREIGLPIPELTYSGSLGEDWYVVQIKAKEAGVGPDPDWVAPTHCTL